MYKHADILNSFPCVFPFSQMYPLCCVNMRNFIEMMYLFSDESSKDSGTIDETVRNVSKRHGARWTNIDESSHSMICCVILSVGHCRNGCPRSIQARSCRF